MKRFDVLCILFITACGTNSGDPPDVSNRDPRCVAACPESMPQYDGVGTVCDNASRTQCLDECEARIAGLPTQCQNCLVEDAQFGNDYTTGGSSCTETTCTLTSDFGTCSYPVNDHAAEIVCLQKVDPRREVSCSASFKSATKCATVCPTM
jgi:hypothetical protein